nr:arf-GAP domain and FG repeat-containing protein 1-like isoform X2 [Lytechinus pictus]
MASKRKQDDKHLKQLREMVSREHNKTCFECNQRGPTYVDMTIGTFVCTSCSGILRGINPPHRVKSISMASYTAAEMTFLEKNGNEVCRHIWLGLYDSKSQPGPESKEDTKVRDYLVQKYEKKRWYVEPGQAAVLAAAKAKEVAESAERKSTSSSHSTPEPKPLKSLIGSNAAPIKVSQPPGHSTSTHNISKPPTLAQTANKQKSVDLLADLGGDPFASASQPAQTGGFGQTPFGQATQQSPFGQPAQQAGFGQQQTPFGQQAAFGQPAQQGGFADFSQAFGGQPQSSQAFPENNPKKESFDTSSGGSGDLADLFFSPQTTQQNDPFMPAAQPAAGSAPSNNNFGAFESAFTPQSAPVPVASSAAPLNPTVQGLQGLSIANASPPSGGAAASASSGGDKYAAFALMDSNATTRESTTVNWSGGSSSSAGINWGGGGGGSVVPKSSSSSGFDWGTGMAKSSPQAFPGTGSGSATSLGTTSTSAAQLFGSTSFGAQGVPQGNPFMAISSSATPATSTMANNPFLAGGAQGAPAQANGLFGMQPAGAPGMPAQNPMMIAGAGGAFNQQTPTPGANMQMNGRVGAGFPQGQFHAGGGFGGMPQGAMPNQFGMGMPVSQPQQPQQTPQGGMSFGGAGMAAMAGLQFNKMGQPQQPMAQFGAPQQPTPQGQQQMTAWGAAPNAVPQQNPMAPNPFLSLGGGGFGGQAAIPPKSSNASNPFL